MKKFIGINRNKLSAFQQAKTGGMKKKNRFKIPGKQEDQMLSEPSTVNNLITNTTQNSSNQDQQNASRTVQVYQQAKDSLRIVNELKKKIIQQCKLRITSFKESEVKKYDQNICNLSRNAIQHLLLAQKALTQIRKLKGGTEFEQKYYRNMEKSLAQEIRESSRQLRAQEKQHFQRIRSYQLGTANSAIQLSESQKQKMKGDFDFDYDGSSSGGLVQELQQNTRNTEVNELVKSINKLTTIYKQLNELVIEQGSIIDRIDFNIEETLFHVQQGNKHLHSADEHASNSCAQKCMLILFSIIIIMAVILGLKYSSE